MKLNSSIIFLVVLMFSCSNKSNKSEPEKIRTDSIIIGINKTDSDQIDWKSYTIQSKPDTSHLYKELKKSIKLKRIAFRDSKISNDSIAHIFTETLLNKIIPYWYGTPWSFSGHSSIPNEGTIACGYFVSTTLKDIGLNLDRYKLAQQLPINEAKSINIDQEIIKISNETVSENITEIQSILKEGIYFIGFDQNHVGYILKRNNKLFLLHSNYVNQIGVEIEPIEVSSVFASFRRFYIAEISTNKELIRRWISNEKIKVITR